MTRLKIELDKKGVTQKWLAEKTGVTTAAMCRYVSGDRIPKAPLACKMAQLLGVEVSDLYPADGDPADYLMVYYVNHKENWNYDTTRD